MTSRYDVAVIGGGVAGAAAATWLARRGLKVALFERERETRHKVCGEFLSGESAPLLEDLGLDLQALGARPINSFRVHGARETFASRLPIPASGLSRLVLDQALLRGAEAAGAEVHRGVMVRDARIDDDGIALALSVKRAGGGDDALDEVRARFLILAAGKHDFKSLNPRAGRDRGLVGFKTHLRLDPAAERSLAGYCDLFVFAHGYGGISAVEGGAVNLCVLIEKNAVRPIMTGWPSLMRHVARSCPQVASYFEAATILPGTSVTVANIPYGFVRRAEPPPGVFCVGDQMAVIPSLTGDGMTIALATASLAVNEITGGGFASRYQRVARAELVPKVGLGFQAHRLFRSPRLCDWTIRLIRKFPFLASEFILATRFKPIERPGLQAGFVSG